MAKSSRRTRPPIDGFEIAHERGVLFVDDGFIDRDEALRRFMAPIAGHEDVTAAIEMVGMLGNNELASLNPSSSFIAPQIRDRYDSERIIRTGKNIRDGSFGQLQNCGVAFLDDEHVEQYLTDLNAYFQSDIKLSDLRKHPEFGCYIITIFGHNRQLAIASANIESTGNPDAGSVQMMAKVFRNVTFWQAIEAQATENTGESPSMWERARSIVFYKRLRYRDGVPPTQEEIASRFNVHTDQIWRAERYDALPQPIKDHVMEDRLKYSASFELDVLIPIYGEDYVIKLADRLADRRASTPQVINEVKKRMAAARLTPEVRLLIDEGSMTLPQAQELQKLVGIVSDDEINRLATYFVIGDLDIDAMRAKIRTTIEEKTSGAVQLFDQEDDDPVLIKARRDMAESMRTSAIREDIRKAMLEITRRVSDIMSIQSAGLFGEAAEGVPVISTSPEELFDRITAFADGADVDLTIVRETIDRLNSVGNIINGHEPSLHTMIDQIVSLLEAAANETAASQAKRRQVLGVTTVRLSESVQEAMF